MGIHISSYTVLDSLASGASDSHIRSLISPFNLFAFIVGSPKENATLFETLETRFDRLSFVTGARFLFFSLAKPSNSRRRGIGKFQPSSIGLDHEGVLARALVAGMGIPESALPCIVVTNDLESKEILWFNTASDSIEEQLTVLGHLASRYDRAQLYQALVADQISFDPNKPNGSVSLATSVAQAIADVLSFPVYRVGELDYQRARERATRTLDWIFNSLKKEKSKSTPSPDDDPSQALLERLESNAFKGLSYLSLLTERPDLTLFSGTLPSIATEYGIEYCRVGPRDPRTGLPLWPRERRSGVDDEAELELGMPAPIEEAQRWPNLRQLGEPLEAESIFTLKTALLVQDHFDTHPEFVDGLIGGQIDHTPTVMCLAKVFEREANFSVVHWIRARLHISLPPYFNKYQPAHQAMFTPDLPNPRAIDFNMGVHGRWIAPSLGQSEIACREVGQTSPPDGWSENDWHRLMTHWHVIRVGRNRAAHTELIDQESATRIGNAIDRLAQHRIFESMCALKATYRGF